MKDIYKKLLITILMIPLLVYGGIDTTKIVTLTNELRAEQGISPLVRSKTLDLVARDKLIDMRTKRYFSHTSPTGLKYYNIMQKRGYKFVGAGENLARGYHSASETVEAWTNSPLHYKNLVESRFNEVGVATDGSYTVQIFSKSK